MGGVLRNTYLEHLQLLLSNAHNLLSEGHQIPPLHGLLQYPSASMPDYTRHPPSAKTASRDDSLSSSAPGGKARRPPQPGRAGPNSQYKAGSVAAGMYIGCRGEPSALRARQ